MFDEGTTTRELAISLLLVVLVVVPGAGFLRLLGRTRRGPRLITPQLAILVALLTPAAAIAAGRLANDAAFLIAGLGVGDAHWLWHFLWAVAVIAIAFGLHRFRRAWPATGWTGRCLAAADWLMRGIAAGNALAAVGAAIPFRFEWRLDYVLAAIFHTLGEFLGAGSLLILLAVCVVLLGVGVRGVLRPMTAQLS